MRSARVTLGAVAVLIAASFVAPGGCSKHEAPDAGVAVVEDLSPVPAPEGLVGDLFLPSPDATWTKVRAIAGNSAAFLPQSFGGIAATLLKLPIVVAGEIDGGVPVLGVVAKQGTAPAFGAVGIHVKAGDRFVDQLTLGPDARWVAKRDEASRITMITPKQADPNEQPAFVIGVLGNYLLVAQKLDALKAIGPYIARTLPPRTPPKEDLAFEISEAALSGPVLESARLKWASIRNDVDNAGVPITPFAGTMSTVLDALGDAKQARVTVDLDSKGAHARFTLAPKPGGGPAEKAITEMVVGDSKPLFDLPESTQLAVLWRDTAASRAASLSAEVNGLVKLIGEKDVTPEDKEAITAALRAESEARGEFTTLSLGLDPVGIGATARAAVADEAKMSKALKQILELTKLGSVKARLKGASLSVSSGKAVVENLPGDVQRVRFERLDKDDKGKDDKGKDDKGKDDKAPKAIDLLYLVTRDMLFGAVGGDPKEALRAMAKPSAGARLGAIAEVSTALAALGSDASFVLVADPIRVVAARAGKSAPEQPAPVVLAVGKSGTPATLFGRIDVAAKTIQELVKHRNAF